MRAVTSKRCKKWSTVIGGFLSLCAMGMCWYWGNLSVYVTSYIIVKSGHTEGVTGPWLLAGYDLGSVAGSLFSGFLLQRHGKRLVFGLGASLATLTLISTYLTLRLNAIAMEFITGTLFATGHYIVYAVVMRYCAEWATDDFGFLSAITQSGPPSGAIVFNQIMTWFINPGNLNPDSRLGPLIYFSQCVVLDNVPYLLLLLAALVVALTLIGILLMQNNNEQSQSYGNGDNSIPIKDNDEQTGGLNSSHKNSEYSQDNSDTMSTEATRKFYGASTDGGGIFTLATESITGHVGNLRRNNDDNDQCHLLKIATADEHSTPSFNGQLPSKENQTQTHQTFQETLKTSFHASYNSLQFMYSGMNKISGDFQPDKEATENLTGKSQARDEDNISPWRLVVRHPLFVHYVILASVGNSNYIFISTYYKLYGQEYIHDDHVITYMSILIMVAMGTSRAGWGKILDRFGTKTAFVANFSSAGLLVLVFYFAPVVNGWLYVVAAPAFTAAGSNIFIILSYVSYKTFGLSNMVVAFGLALLPVSLGAPLISYIFESILESGGWFWLFSSCAAWNLFGLLYAIIALPQ